MFARNNPPIMDESPKLTTLPLDSNPKEKSFPKSVKTAILIFPWVAETEGEIVGHIMFSPTYVRLDHKIIGGMGLAPMSVHPNFQKNGHWRRVDSRRARAYKIRRISIRDCPRASGVLSAVRL